MTFKLGRLPHVRPIGLRDLTCYTGGALPAAPATFKPPVYSDWGLLGNDQFGDCTCAAVVHLLEANAVEDKQPYTPPSEQEVVSEYFKLTGGQDTGLNEANVLQVWARSGLFGTTIGGYAPGDQRDEDQLRSIVAQFGASYLGVVIPEPAQQQFSTGQPWDLTHTSADQNIEGGHAVPIIGYDADYAYVVTWGATQPATWRWMATYLEEAWAVLTPADERVDLRQLQQDLKILK